jgi:hypothetical protein
VFARDLMARGGEAAADPWNLTGFLVGMGAAPYGAERMLRPKAGRGLWRAQAMKTPPKLGAVKAKTPVFNENGITRVGNAEITLHRWGDSREVYATGLKAHEAGAGTSLLRDLAKWADESGVRLIGDVRPMAAEPGVKQLTQDELFRLYERYGFKKYGSDSVAREPSMKPPKLGKK